MAQSKGRDAYYDCLPRSQRWLRTGSDNPDCVGGNSLEFDQGGYSLDRAVSDTGADIDPVVKDALERMHAQIAQAMDAVDDVFVAVNAWIIQDNSPDNPRK